MISDSHKALYLVKCRLGQGGNTPGTKTGSASSLHRLILFYFIEVKIIDCIS